MKMTNLKLPKKAKEELKKTAMPEAADIPEYPYGLQLRFDKDLIARLPYLKGVDGGQECSFTCKGFISNLSVNKSADEAGKSKERQSVEIQVTDIGFGDGKKKPEEMDAKEYAQYRRG